MNITKKRISDLMHERNTSQQQLADFIPITQATLSRNISDPEKMNIITIARISAFFDVSLDYLLGRVDEKKEIVKQIRVIDNPLTSPLANTPEYKSVIDKVDRLTRDELIFLNGAIATLLGSANITENIKRNIS